MQSTGFRKLRIAVAASLVAGVGGGLARRATAASGALPRTVVKGSAKWELGTGAGVGGHFGDDNALGISKATVTSSSTTSVTHTHTHKVTHHHNEPSQTCLPLPTSIVPSTLICHTKSVDQTSKTTKTTTTTVVQRHVEADTKALDGSMQLKVGGQVFTAPGGTVDSSGSSVTTAKQIGGLDVQARYDFLDGATARVLYSFTNPTSTTKKVGVLEGSAFKSTAVGDTSDGDKTIEATDSWFGLASDFPNKKPGIVFARGNATDALKGKILDAPGSGSGIDVESFALKVGPRKTVRLLFFVRLAMGDAEGAAFKDKAHLEDAGLLDGLSSAELKQVKNWKKLA